MTEKKEVNTDKLKVLNAVLDKIEKDFHILQWEADQHGV